MNAKDARKIRSSMLGLAKMLMGERLASRGREERAMSTPNDTAAAPVHADVRRWGRFPLFPAKVGTGPSTLILVRRDRTFAVGQRIKFATLDDVQGMCQGVTPRWRNGVVWKIDGGRLFVSL